MHIFGNGERRFYSFIEIYVILLKELGNHKMQGTAYD